MLEVKLYRHKEYKDMFLYGYSEPKMTSDAVTAVEDFRCISQRHWSQNKPIHAQLTMHAEVDGYSGELTKDITLMFGDFEVVTLREVE